jgi:hypothetical protein
MVFQVVIITGLIQIFDSTQTVNFYGIHPVVYLLDNIYLSIGHVVITYIQNIYTHIYKIVLNFN